MKSLDPIQAARSAPATNHCCACDFGIGRFATFLAEGSLTLHLALLISAIVGRYLAAPNDDPPLFGAEDYRVTLLNRAHGMCIFMTREVTLPCIFAQLSNAHTHDASSVSLQARLTEVSVVLGAHRMFDTSCSMVNDGVTNHTGF